MSAAIYRLVMHKRAAQVQAVANGERYAQLIAEAKGANGEAPEHEWKGTKLRFRNPDGSWGKWVDLRGKTGADGVTVISGGGSGARFDPASLPPYIGSPSLSDNLVIEKNGVAYRIALSQLQLLFGSGGALPANATTVNGEAVTANGEYVTVT